VRDRLVALGALLVSASSGVLLSSACSIAYAHRLGSWLSVESLAVINGALSVDNRTHVQSALLVSAFVRLGSSVFVLVRSGGVSRYLWKLRISTLEQ
jgi:hypothetical protein